MKILLLTCGSRGDIQPSCVLGSELKRKGHSVWIAADKRFKGFIDQFQLDYKELAGDICESLFTKEGRRYLSTLSLEELYKLQTIHDLSTPGRFESFYQAAIGMDLTIPSALCITESVCIKDKLNIPFIPLFLVPALPTSCYPHLFVTKKNLYFGYLNRLTYQLVSFKLNALESARVNSWRVNGLGLEPFGSRNIYSFFDDQNSPIILACSEVLFQKEKKPKDYLSQWELTGFFYPSFQFPIPNTVEDFLRSGENPILFGMGSMAIEDPIPVLNIVRAAVRKLGKRLIFVKGWTEFDQHQLEDVSNDKDLLVVDSIDYGSIFPHCSVVIHHGGVGTTASALKAGVPSLVTWQYVDQPYWGNRIEEMGVGLSLSIKSITQELIYTSLKTLLENQSFKKRAQEISTIVQRESINSVEKAVGVIEKHFNSMNIILGNKSI